LTANRRGTLPSTYETAALAPDRPGRLSLGGLAGLLGFLAIFYAAVALGAHGGDTFFSNPLLAIPVTLAGISGVTAFGVGLFRVVRSREGALAVIVATLIGLFVIIFIIGEFTTPH
jgi:hypothetical protein